MWCDQVVGGVGAPGAGLVGVQGGNDSSSGADASQRRSIPGAVVKGPNIERGGSRKAIESGRFA